jgi:hypothetical protein
MCFVPLYNNIENELYTYLSEKRVDKKVSIYLLLNILRTNNPFIINFLYLDTNLLID